MLETISHTRPGRLRAWLIAGALGLSVTLAAAQGPASFNTPLNAPGKSVSGRVSEPGNETPAAIVSGTMSTGPATAEPSPGAPPATSTAPVSEPNAMSTPLPNAPLVQKPSSSEWAAGLDLPDPRVNPIAAAAAVLTLMAVLAWLAYRRNRRAQALNSTTSPALSEAAPANPMPSEAGDPFSSHKSLQAEIMALDLELGPSNAPPLVETPVESFVTPSISPESPAPAVHPVDLSLQKLQWAQQLLAAGENELARVLLTSVAESLHSQLQQRHTPHQEPRQ